MSDLFHDEVPVSYIQKVFAVMVSADWHRFQVLTKRAERLEKLSSKLRWEPNIWMGVSVESNAYRGRIGPTKVPCPPKGHRIVEELGQNRTNVRHEHELGSRA
jgi:protein gp37